VKNEAWIDTEHPVWTSKKFVGNGGSKALSPSASYSSTSSVFAAELLTCSNVTHSGRDIGAKEAVRLNCPEEEISSRLQMVSHFRKIATALSRQATDHVCPIHGRI
jgi:hypothetical protein